MAKDFGLEIKKLELDYKKARSRFHEITEEEKEYIKHDVLIVAQALKTLFDEGLTKMTQGANALSDYKKILGQKKFSHYFPILKKEEDKNIRESYKRWIYVFITRICRKRSKKWLCY